VWAYVPQNLENFEFLVKMCT